MSRLGALRARRLTGIDLTDAQNDMQVFRAWWLGQVDVGRNARPDPAADRLECLPEAPRTACRPCGPPAVLALEHGDVRVGGERLV